MQCARRCSTVLVCLLLASACSNSSSGAPSTSAARTVGSGPGSVADSGPANSSDSTASTEATDSGMTAQDAATVLSSFSWDNDDAQYTVHDHRSDAALVKAAGDALATNPSGAQLWVATWIWVNEGDDPAPLLPLLTNADPSIRIMAATGLIARGRAEGFAPLIDELNDMSVLIGQEPPTTAWAQAATSLVRFTGISDNGPPFDADASRRVLAQQRWRDWFAANQAALTFTAEEGLWHAA
jgi:hypothetical protein